jgi:hypothetical protein
MLRRLTPLRRSAFKRSGHRSKYRRRLRAIPFMLWVKRQPCSARFLDCNSPCIGRVEADHAGRRGIGQKASDYTCVPLCSKHHAERTNFSGVFKSWDQARMRFWLAQRIWFTQRMAITNGVHVPGEEIVDLEVHA